MSRRRLVLGAHAAAFGLVAALAIAVRLAPFPALEVPPGQRAILGFFHVHTTRSHDGRGTMEDAALAARRLGGRFLVVTEHNLLEPPAPTVVEGVLVVPGVEISAEAGHVIALGVSEVPAERGPGVLRAIEESGGLAVLAHPVNLKRPWADPASEGFVGFEALSLDSAFREATLRRQGRLFWPLVALAGDHRKLAALLMHRPDEALGRYDEIAEARDLAMLCGVDAHGLPPYLSSFAALGLNLWLSPAQREAWGRDPEADAGAVLKAIAEARTFCSVPALGDASSFSFRVEGGEVVAEVAVAQVRIALFRDGQEVARGPGPALRTPWRPGSWRAEVYVEAGFPWGGERLWIASSALPLTSAPEGS